MTTKNDGGPAFPRGAYSFDPEDPKKYPSNGLIPAQKGMSLRDWFAGMALQSLLPLFTTGKLESKKGKIDEALISEQAYYFADAMLKEREK